MGRFLDFVFNRFFLGMIATAFFWLLTLAGGIILGLAPASATLMSLYAEHGYSSGIQFEGGLVSLQAKFCLKQPDFL